MYKLASLNFCFKGKRNYIQGPDIYDKINKLIINELLINNISKIDMSVHKLIKNNLTLEMYKNEDVDKKEDTVAVFSFIHDSNKYKLLLSENNEKIDCRYEYPEEDIIKKCKINVDKQMIILESKTDFSDAEVFTAMNKALLNSIYPDIKGKWLFTKFQIDKYDEKGEYDYISVELKHNFSYKLTKSLIKIDDKERGYIYFSLI